MNLLNKKILITGAAGGLGSALARELASAGASLILVGRRAEPLNSLCQSLPSRIQHLTVCGDIASEAGRAAIFDVVSKSGLDVLVNNAAVNRFALLGQQSEKEIEEQLVTNLVAPVTLTRQLLPILQAAPEAVIMNVGSGYGSIGYPGYTSYCASKFGLKGFSEALRRELSDSHIKVVHIAPRATLTKLNSASANALNRHLGNAVDRPEDVARIAAKHLARGRGDKLIGWPERLFVRLNALLPSIVDAAIYKQLPLIRHYAGASECEYECGNRGRTNFAGE